jgi:hypothetical protein
LRGWRLEPIGLEAAVDVIPVPELIVVLIVAGVLLVARSLWSIRPFPFAPRPGDFRPGQPPPTTEQLRARCIAACVIFATIAVPLILQWIPPNGIYGFRTGETLSSRAIWYPANAFMGWALLTAAIVSTTLLMTMPAAARRWMVWAAFVAPVIGAMAASLAYLGRLT